jgi:hypothetical protein
MAAPCEKLGEPFSITMTQAVADVNGDATEQPPAQTDTFL